MTSANFSRLKRSTKQHCNGRYVPDFTNCMLSTNGYIGAVATVSEGQDDFRFALFTAIKASLNCNPR